MNQAEQEKQIRAVKKSCRGPALADPKVVREHFDLWYELEAKGKTEPMLVMISALRIAAQDVAAKGFIVSLPPNADEPGVLAGEEECGTVAELRRAAFPLIRLRGDTVGRGCGRDFNETILAYPFDGTENKDECPGCGVVTSWKAPVFAE